MNKTIARLDREEKKVWKLYVITTILIIIIDLIFLLWKKSMWISGNLGFIIGMFIASWMSRETRREIRR